MKRASASAWTHGAGLAAVAAAFALGSPGCGAQEWTFDSDTTTLDGSALGPSSAVDSDAGAAASTDSGAKPDAVDSGGPSQTTTATDAASDDDAARQPDTGPLDGAEGSDATPSNDAAGAADARDAADAADADVPCTATSCPSGLNCDTTNGQCVECTGTGQCTAAGEPVCDLATNRCVACNVAKDCGTGFACISSQCIPSCGDAGTCPSGTHCNAAGTTCIQCSAAADCSGVSSGGVSLPLCDTATNQCVQCTVAGATTSGCTSGLVCDTTRGRCVQCTSNAQCPEESVCGSSETCVAEQEGENGG